MKLNARVVAFVAAMCGLANVLGVLTIHTGAFNIHFTQIPVILAALSVGPTGGALVGFFGFIVSAFTLARPNPFILGGNAILGFCTGLFYWKMRRISARPIVPQVISVLGAYLVQAPYVFFTDTYLMGMPVSLVYTIMALLLVEDIISVFICHVILFRIDIRKALLQF